MTNSKQSRLFGNYIAHCMPFEPRIQYSAPMRKQMTIKSNMCLPNWTLFPSRETMKRHLLKGS